MYLCNYKDSLLLCPVGFFSCLSITDDNGGKKYIVGHVNAFMTLALMFGFELSWLSLSLIMVMAGRSV